MKQLFMTALCGTVALGTHADENDTLRKASPHSVMTTVERFEAAVRTKGEGISSHRPRRSGKGIPANHAARGGRGIWQSEVRHTFYGRKPRSRDRLSTQGDRLRRCRVWLAYNSASYLYEGLFRRHDLDYPEFDVGFFRNVLESLIDRAIGTESITH